MKKINVLLSLVLLIFSISTFAQTSKKTKPVTGTSNEKVDAVYRAVLKAYAKDTAFVNRLTVSQKLWKKMKDADLDMRFPVRKKNEPLNVTYGSAINTCIPQLISKMNAERINYLNQWLKGVPEGDVCAGSIKILK